MADPFATLLMTRPAKASESFLRSFDDEGLKRVDTIISPLFEIAPTGRKPDLTGISGVIFTSSNAVEHGGPGFDLPAFCVGQRTCAAAKEKGWRAQMSGMNAASLVQSLKRARPSVPLLHIAGVQKRADLSHILTKAGLLTHAIDVYDQIPYALSPQAHKALTGEKSTIVPLFSPRTAARIFELTGDVVATHVVGLSSAVLDEVPHGWAVTRAVADTPDADGMKVALMKLLRWVEAGDTPQ